MSVQDLETIMPLTSFRPALFTLAALALLHSRPASQVRSADWPQFRGQGGQGVNPGAAGAMGDLCQQPNEAQHGDGSGDAAGADPRAAGECGAGGGGDGAVEEGGVMFEG